MKNLFYIMLVLCLFYLNTSLKAKDVKVNTNLIRVRKTRKPKSIAVIPVNNEDQSIRFTIGEPQTKTSSFTMMPKII